MNRVTVRSCRETVTAGFRSFADTRYSFYACCSAVKQGSFDAASFLLSREIGEQDRQRVKVAPKNRSVRSLAFYLAENCRPRKSSVLFLPRS